MMNEKNTGLPCSFETLKVMGKRLRLTTMIEHAEELSMDENSRCWSINQWLDVLCRTEIERREGVALNRRLKEARLEYADADYGRIDQDPKRLLDMARINTVFAMDWIARKQNCIITGTTGTGKTWLANAICRAACIRGYKVMSIRMSTLLRKFARFQTPVTTGSDLQIKFLQGLSKLDLLHIDDWAVGVGMQNHPEYRTGLYEIIDQCSHRTSILTSGVPPVEVWAQFIGDPTVADSILDRLVPRAIRLALTGPSLREKEQYGGIPQRGNENEG